MKKIILIFTLLLMMGCKNSITKPLEEQQVEIDSIKFTVDFLNSLEWTEEEVQHLDTITDNLVCRNAERDLDTIINHIKVKFIINE